MRNRIRRRTAGLASLLGLAAMAAPPGPAVPSEHAPPVASAIASAKPLNRPAPGNLDLLVPAIERGIIPYADVDGLLSAPRPAVFEALERYAAASHECARLTSMDRPAEPDSIDVLRYDIHILEVNEPQKRFRATTTVTVRALRPLAAFDLHLVDCAVDRVERLADGGYASSVLNFTPFADRVRLGPFPATLPAGASIRVAITYHSTSTGCFGESGAPGGVVFTSFGTYTFAEPVYARHWFPSHDVPWDKAAVSITVDVPGGREASAVGTLVEDMVVNGRRRMRWVLEEPVATYLVAFYLGDFVKLEDAAPGGVPLEYFVFADRVEKARADFVHLPEMIGFYSRVHPYPFARYAMTLGIFAGGMEHQTNSLIGASWVKGNLASESLYAHELAHQWWGDLVTPATWRDIWLNEGFATYFELLFAEHLYGFEALQDGLALRDSVYKAHPEFDYPLLDHPPDRVLSFVVYNKGARVLHMLRSIARLGPLAGRAVSGAEFREAALEGDRRFLGIFARYARANAFGNVATEHFKQAAESVLDEDLTWFFHPWLYGKGYPRLEWDWRATPIGAGAVLDVRVRQVQSEPGVPFFRMPVHFRLRRGDSVLESVHVVGGRLTEFSLDLPPGDWQVDLDPEGWLLATRARAALFPALTRFTVAPNPSAGPVTLEGNLAGEEPGTAELDVFDVRGRLVRRFDAILVQPGSFAVEWDRRGEDGDRVPAGVYFARLRVGYDTAIRRVVLLPR